MLRPVSISQKYNADFTDHLETKYSVIKHIQVDSYHMITIYAILINIKLTKSNTEFQFFRLKTSIAKDKRR